MLVLLLFSSTHLFSIGFRSEDWNGHSRRLVLCSVTHFCVVSEVCVGIIERWKIQTWLIIRFLTESVTYWFFICWYLIESIGAFPLHGTAWHGTLQYSSLLWGFPLGTVPGTWYLVRFLLPPRPRFQVIRTVTKTWRVNSTDHWLAGKKLSLLHQGSDATFVWTNFLYQPKNGCFVVCWGSADIPLVDSRGADLARAWWGDAEWKSLMYILSALCIFLEYVFCLYLYLLYMCFASIKKQSDRISLPPDYIKNVLLYEHVMNLLKKTND